MQANQRRCRFSFGSLSLDGFSTAGQETWFVVRPPGIALDAGRGHPALAGASRIFLTHGHIDHFLGTAYAVSHRSLHRDQYTEIYCPREIEDPLRRWLRLSEEMEGASYRCAVHGIEPGERVQVDGQLWVEPFATSHVVPSLGYHLVRRGRKLRPEVAHLPQDELDSLRQKGEAIWESVERDWVSFSGDTEAEVLDRELRLYRTEILVLECTFVGADSVEKSRRYGHLHLDDLRERCDRFENDHLVLHHFSARYSAAAIREAVADALVSAHPELHLLLP